MGIYLIPTYQTSSKQQELLKYNNYFDIIFNFNHKLIDFIEIKKYHMESNILSSENNENEVLTITSEPLSPEDHYERKPQDNRKPW